jgi:hypothetical protein
LYWLPAGSGDIWATGTGFNAENSRDGLKSQKGFTAMFWARLHEFLVSDVPGLKSPALKQHRLATIEFERLASGCYLQISLD